MAHAELAVQIPTSADNVWALLSGPDFRALITSLYAESISVLDTASGMEMTTVLRDGRGTVKERVEKIDNSEKVLRYRLLESGPMPYANYRGEMRVTHADNNNCYLSFECDFIPA